MNLHDWIDELSDVLGLEDVEVDEGLLADLSMTAVTNVERLAAPVTAYLLGYAAGSQDLAPEGVERLAGRAQSLAEGWDRPAGFVDRGLEALLVPDDSGVDHSTDRYEEYVET
jgi:hypothetical protein